MSQVKIIRVYHPSGKLFDAYRKFSEAHQQAVFFQSEGFIRLIEEWPEADWLLLLAVRDDELMDPGARPASYRPGDIFNKNIPKNTSSDTSNTRSTNVEPSKIAASLLAVVVREKAPATALLKPFAGLYRSLTSRTIVYGGPLLGDTTRLQKELITGNLLKALHQQVRKRSLFTQFRNSHDLTDLIPLFRERRYEFQERLNLLVSCVSRDKAWQNLSASRRRQIRLSQKNGATIIENPDKNQVDAFYSILKDLYEQKIKKPLPGKPFFYALAGLSETSRSTAANISPDDQADKQTAYSKTLLVMHEGRVIGGIACVLTPGKCIHEWYVCGLDLEYKRRQIFPSVMATWAAIEYATANNIPTFDFMGLGKPGEPYGVRDFKEKFGGSWVNHGRFFRVNQAFLYFLVELGYNVFYLFKKLKQ